MEKIRKKKVRYIQKMPKIAQFSPRGKAGRPEEVELRVDQFEAIKLADYQGYDQSESAAQMGLSRPSFGRIIRSARKQVADALVNGKTIKIRTGDIQVGVKRKDLPVKDKSVGSAQNVEEILRKSILKYNPRRDIANKVKQKGAM